MPSGNSKSFDSFDFKPGRVLAGKYEVLAMLGAGWEGEVYRVREVATGIQRAAKFFFPRANTRNRQAIWNAKKLHKLRSCPIVIQYQTQDRIQFKGERIIFLVSEYVRGVLLSNFIAQQPGKRLSPFQGLHLLHALASGIERIHFLKEYHGDLHSDNVIVCKYGLRFDLKLLDLHRWEAPRKENIQDDVVNLIKILYESVGGAKWYAKQPKSIKQICCGLKHSLILKKFKNASQLREHIEVMEFIPLFNSKKLSYW